MVVAMDGPAGVGKSTVAARVAREVGFLYLNSGDLYRSVTRRVLDREADPEDRDLVLKVAQECSFSFVDGQLRVDGRPEKPRLHSDRIDRWVSPMPPSRSCGPSSTGSCAPSLRTGTSWSRAGTWARWPSPTRS